MAEERIFDVEEEQKKSKFSQLVDEAKKVVEDSKEGVRKVVTSDFTKKFKPMEALEDAYVNDKLIEIDKARGKTINKKERLVMKYRAKKQNMSNRLKHVKTKARTKNGAEANKLMAQEKQLKEEIGLKDIAIRNEESNIVLLKNKKDSKSRDSEAENIRKDFNSLDDSAKLDFAARLHQRGNQVGTKFLDEVVKDEKVHFAPELQEKAGKVLGKDMSETKPGAQRIKDELLRDLDNTLSTSDRNKVLNEISAADGANKDVRDSVVVKEARRSFTGKSATITSVKEALQDKGRKDDKGRDMEESPDGGRAR